MTTDQRDVLLYGPDHLDWYRAQSPIAAARDHFRGGGGGVVEIKEWRLLRFTDYHFDQMARDLASSWEESYREEYGAHEGEVVSDWKALLPLVTEWARGSSRRVDETGNSSRWAWDGVAGAPVLAGSES